MRVCGVVTSVQVGQVDELGRRGGCLGLSFAAVGQDHIRVGQGERGHADGWPCQWRRRGGEWVKFEKSESYREKKRERKEPLESSP